MRMQKKDSSPRMGTREGLSRDSGRQPRVRLDAIECASRCWEAFDTPVSLSCALLRKYGEWDQLARKSVKPLDYIDPLGFALDYQSVKFLSKYPYLPTGIDTRAVAYEKFEQSEDRCRETNERFRKRVDGEIFLPHVERVLSHAQRKISLILGGVPKLADLDFRFGPGAAFGVRGETSAYNKVASDFECTHALAGIIPNFLAEFPGWVRSKAESLSTRKPTVMVVPGSQLSFVPKDAKTDRPICIEPLLNGLYQKGVGSFLRTRLRRHGVNLDDQGVNQKLASRAVTAKLATIDFSSASDTVAYSLVLDLLPIDWVEFLDVARSPCFLWEGVWRNFQKFSSMGNAYTFELETLIFYALACASCEVLGIEYQTGENLSVYGDDVIIPQAAFDLFQEVCVVCGFELNEEKSFHNGLFFESCGHDYYNGYQVRPFLFTKRLETLGEAFYAANIVRRSTARLSGVPSTSNDGKGNLVGQRLHGVRLWIVRRIPERYRYQGPEGYGDGHLSAEWDECLPALHPSIFAWKYRSLVEQPLKYSPPCGDDGLPEWPYAYALYSGASSRAEEPIFGSQALDYRQVEKLEEVPLPLHNGKGYTVRGRTRTVLKHLLCPINWPSGVNWEPARAGFPFGFKPKES